MHTCPHCKKPLEVEIRLTGAPPMQSSGVNGDPAQESLESLLNAIDDRQIQDPKEAEFIIQTRERFEKYGSRTMMSEKQLNWLKRIRDNQ